MKRNYSYRLISPSLLNPVEYIKVRKRLEISVATKSNKVSALKSNKQGAMILVQL